MSDIFYLIGFTITLFITVLAGGLTVDQAVFMFFGYIGGLSVRSLRKWIFG